jgi:hypothetical protein
MVGAFDFQRVAISRGGAGPIIADAHAQVLHEDTRSRDVQCRAAQQDTR